MKESLRRFLITLWFPHSRLFWAFLFLGFIFYEACGLYFQYVLHLNPCIECVYERACFMFFGVAALLGITAPRFFIVRILAVIIWLMSSIKGILISWEHRGYELTKDDPFAETCGFFAEFGAVDHHYLHLQCGYRRTLGAAFLPAVPDLPENTRWRRGGDRESGKLSKRRLKESVPSNKNSRKGPASPGVLFWEELYACPVTLLCFCFTCLCSC